MTPEQQAAVERVQVTRRAIEEAPELTTDELDAYDEAVRATRALGITDDALPAWPSVEQSMTTDWTPAPQRDDLGRSV